MTENEKQPGVPFSWRFESATELDKVMLSGYIGEQALSFLRQEGITLYVQRKPHEYSVQITTFYFGVHGRTVELIHEARFPDSLEICYSFTVDFLANDEQKYEKKGTEKTLGQSIQFIGFLRRFLSSFRKNAPIVFYTNDSKRKGLLMLLIRKSGLTNVRCF